MKRLKFPKSGSLRTANDWTRKKQNKRSFLCYFLRKGNISARPPNDTLNQYSIRLSWHGIIGRMNCCISWCLMEIIYIVTSEKSVQRKSKRKEIGEDERRNSRTGGGGGSGGEGRKENKLKYGKKKCVCPASKWGWA